MWIIRIYVLFNMQFSAILFSLEYIQIFLEHNLWFKKIPLF